MSYISITGLKPKGIISYIVFWRLAIPSFAQARNAKGNHFTKSQRAEPMVLNPIKYLHGLKPLRF